MKNRMNYPMKLQALFTILHQGSKLLSDWKLDVILSYFRTLLDEMAEEYSNLFVGLVDEFLPPLDPVDIIRLARDTKTSLEGLFEFQSDLSFYHKFDVSIPKEGLKIFEKVARILMETCPLVFDTKKYQKVLENLKLLEQIKKEFREAFQSQLQSIPYSLDSLYLWSKEKILNSWRCSFQKMMQVAERFEEIILKNL